MAENPPNTQTESPDGIPEMSMKTAPNSQQLQAQQVVPPSPTSDRSLGSPEHDRIREAGHCESPQNFREVPLDAFKDEHVADIVTLVSMVLTEIVEKNDRTPFSSEKLTRFHSRAAPQISIKDYILRVVKFCKLEKAMLIVCLYLADLFTNSYVNFTLNSLTVHRFLITAFTVAAKGLCDQFCSNTLYARVGGLSVIELNLLEVEFLVRVQYRIVPPMPVLLSIYSRVESKRENPEFRSAAPAPPKVIQSSKAEYLSPRKHPREDVHHSESKPTEEAEHPEVRPRPPGKPSGHKGFKAMKETFKFLHPKKK